MDIRRFTFALLALALLGITSAALAAPAASPAKPASLSEGVAQFRQGDFKQAIDTLKAVVAAESGNLPALYWLGRAYLEAGSNVDARAQFLHVLKTKPDSVDTLYWLGIAYQRSGALEEARARLTRVLELDPRNAAAQQALKTLAGAPAPGASSPPPPPPAAPFAGGDRLTFEAGGLPLEVGEIDLHSGNIYDYTFTDAPVDWFAGSGLWAVTNRWTCSPQWSWEGSLSEKAPATLWNKREFVGDITVEAYVGFKMGTGATSSYKNPNDLNITICGDGINPSSGYSFMVGASRNNDTRIMRGTKVLASTTQPAALLPIFEDGFPSTYDFHRRWWSLRARKHGTKLQLFVDEKLAVEAEDPDPLPGGHVCLWAYDNGLMVSRLKVYYEREVTERHPVPGLDAIQAPLTRLANRSFTLTSTTHASVQSSFEFDADGWTGREAQDPVVLRLTEGGPGGKGHCLAMTNPIPGGPFGVRAIPGPFDINQAPHLSFDYRLPADHSLKVNLYLTVSGALQEVIFSGLAHGSPEARQIGAIPGVVADGAWHHAEFDLLGALEGLDGVGAAYPARDLWFGNLCDDDYLLAGFGGNPAGATWWVGNFFLDKPAGRAVKLAVAPASGLTLQGYSLLLDTDPLTEAPKTVTSAEPSLSASADQSGVYWAHVRGKLGGDQWTETQHYRVQVDESAPQVTEITPAPGGLMPDGPVTMRLTDPGGSGVDLASLKATVNGKPLPLDGVALAYDPNSAVLRMDPRLILDTPKDGDEVKFVLAAVKDRAGNAMPAAQEFTYKISFAACKTAPPAPKIKLGDDGYLVDEDFERTVGDFSSYGGAGGADVSVDPNTPAAGHSSLRLYNRNAGGRFGVYIRKRPFDAGRNRIVSFDYKIPPRLRVDFAVYVNGEWKGIKFKDVTNQLPLIGAVRDVRDDNQWHHAEFNLYEMLRKADPQAAHYVVRQFVIADWSFAANAEGQTYHLDNFQIVPVLSCAKPLPISWIAPDITGIAELGYVLTPMPSPDAAPQIKLPGSSGLLTGAGNFDGWMQARVRDGAGNWSPAANYRVLVDSEPPVAEAVSPAAGQFVAPSTVVLNLKDRGIAGVDPGSIVLSVAGTDYTTDNPGLTYNSETGQLVWNCEKTPEPVVIPDKTQVTVKLKSGSDFAGNAVVNPPQWTWTMDYSKDKTPPVIAAADLVSRTHPTVLTNTFAEGLDGWQTFGGAAGAKVERDTTTAVDGPASVKLTQQQAGGTMGAYVTTEPFEADRFPTLGFDYKIGPGVKLDFMAHMLSGRDFPIGFTGDDAGTVGRVPGVVADGTWRHAAVDLGGILRAQQPQGTLDVLYLYLTNRNTPNPAGAVAWFDNLIIGKVGNGQVVFRWHATDATGIVGYSYVLDNKPGTVPPPVSLGPKTANTFPRPEPGRWFLHLRACDGAGNWGPTRHYGIMQGAP